MKDLMGLMKQAQAMQQKMAEAQSKLDEAEVTGEAGAGLITVTMDGDAQTPTFRLKVTGSTTKVPALVLEMTSGKEPERIDAQLPAVGVGLWREHEGELADVQALVVCEGACGPHLSKVREPTIAIRNMLQIRKRCAGAE